MLGDRRRIRHKKAHQTQKAGGRDGVPITGIPFNNFFSESMRAA